VGQRGPGGHPEQDRDAEERQLIEQNYADIIE
jgi:hypothetical protein